MKSTVSKNKIEFLIDYDPETPRNYDNLGFMYCLHKRYSIGDKHNYSIEDLNKIENSKNNISLPVYLYDHSGITINTTGFNCPWDSGKLGIITVSKEKVRKEYNIKRISKKFETKIKEYLNNEIKEYDKYLNNEVYGYRISDNDNNEIDSCYGFIGNNLKDNGMLDNISKEYHEFLPENIILDTQINLYV